MKYECECGADMQLIERVKNTEKHECLECGQIAYARAEHIYDEDEA